MNEVFQITKAASRKLANIPEEKKKQLLCRLADAIEDNVPLLLEANSADLSRMSSSNPLYDRLLLTADRLAAIASDMRRVAELPSPLGKISCERTLPNGLYLRRILLR